MGLIFCAVVFIAALIGAWRSTVSGLGVVLTTGYLFGIVRANYPDTYSHFIFDSAVLGLYLSLFAALWQRPRNPAEHSLRRWIAVLIGWVGIMVLMPIQHPLIQLVGLRGNAFLIPCALIGNRLDERDADSLAVWLACLNLLALAFGLAEFTLGVERFYPQNQITEIIYRSKDIAGNTAFRIPACFSNAHSYAGTMVMTLPWLAGVWANPRCPNSRRLLLMAGMAAVLIGVFMAGARVFVVQLFIMLLVISFSGKMSGALWFGWVLVLGGIAYIVSGEERMQRFLTLQNTEVVVGRLEGSVNMNFVELLTTYPLGNGLGGGGTSIPFFLQHLIRDPVGMESEYCRILLEQGVVGLALWISFLVWVLTRPAPSPRHPWSLGWRLLWVCCLTNFLMAVLGTGMMTSIPQTSLLFLSMGFLAVPRLTRVKRVRKEPWIASQTETPLAKV